MSTESIDLFFTFFSLAAGLYCLYLGVRLFVQKALFQSSLLLPTDRSLQDCLDEEGYLKVLKPLFTCFGLFITLLSLYNLADTKWGLTAAWFPGHEKLAMLTSVTFLPLLGLVIFAVILRKAQKKYFV